MSLSRTVLAGWMLIFASGLTVEAAPMVVDLQPIAVYEDVAGAFGLAYDSDSDVLWVSLDDGGDGVIHSLRAFSSFTQAELNVIPEIGGVKRIAQAMGGYDFAGITSPAGGAEYRSLAFDSVTGQLVMQGVGPTLVSFDPVTGANMNTDYAPFSAWEGFSDGLDVTDGNVWHSGDTLDIFKNGFFFGMRFDPLQTELSGWTGGDDSKVGINGWAGVQQVGDELWTVGVMTAGDGVGTRTLAGYDAATGELLWYDANGDATAIHFADMAFDGEYIYIADLRGDINSSGAIGDVYVYAIPEPTGAVMMLSMIAVLLVKHK